MSLSHHECVPFYFFNINGCSPPQGEIFLVSRWAVGVIMLRNERVMIVFCEACVWSPNLEVHLFSKQLVSLIVAMSCYNAEYCFYTILKCYCSCRNESMLTHNSVSTSRSPSPTRPLSDSQMDELVSLRQKCEQLEKQLQEERKLVMKCFIMKEYMNM